MRKSIYRKRIALFLLINFGGSLLWPTTSWALTSGAASPEFSSFEPVATTNLVNDFSGDFTYNLPVLSIPGPDGGGYAMSLSYHSGVSAEEEASWVGYGWTLNPGAVNRMKRGYADDFNGVAVTKYNQTRPNWTATASPSYTVEYNSADEGQTERESSGSNSASSGTLKDKLNIDILDFNVFSGEDNPDAEDGSQGAPSPSFTLSKSIRYNNYAGFSSSTTGSFNAAGMGSLSLTRAGGESMLGVSINPTAILTRYIKKKKRDAYLLKEINWPGSGMFSGIFKLVTKILYQSTAAGKHIPSMNFSAHSFGTPSLPYSVAHNTGRSFNFSTSLTINPLGPIGLQWGLGGNMNTQFNIPEVEMEAYGYLHNPAYAGNYDPKPKGNRFEQENYFEAAGHGASQGTLADFTLEKPSTFNKHDRNIGIPHSNPDVFMMSGESSMGGFRFIHDKVGHYYPNSLKNSMDIRQLGVELGFGGTVQVGLNVGIGWQQTMIGPWNEGTTEIETNPALYQHDAANPILRFNGDKGGAVHYTDPTSSKLEYATLSPGSLGSKFAVELDLSDISTSTALQTGEENRTSYVEYNAYDPSGTLSGFFDLSPETRAFDKLSDTVYKDCIAEMKVTDATGSTSIYGLPIFTRNETELSVDVDYEGDPESLTYAPVRFNDPTLNDVAVGQRIAKPYASTYLLTQMTTADYVDVTGNGPDETDFGGWNKFHYRKSAHLQDDAEGNWFRYRVPYTGLNYDRGRLMDKQDQLGSFSSGEREVYYMKAVETKTHVAFFITNETIADELKDIIESRSDLTAQEALVIAESLVTAVPVARLDGLDAAEIPPGGMDEAANDETAQGAHRPENLERIVLFAKSNFNTPVSTTHFEYDYQLCKNIPNGEYAHNNGIAAQGKLTLKKVWTEANGITRSRIAPFEFHYEYFADYPTSITNKYYNDTEQYSINTGYEDLTSSQQNPNYELGQLDAWGNYRLNGPDRANKLQPWVSQDPDDYVGFDPAAWHLKRIELPTGGEIHVQYEQDDYCYVQDQAATVMAELQNIGSTNNSYDPTTNRYFLNLSKLGVNVADDTVVGNYAALLDKHFVEEATPLYFKVLYALTTDATPHLEAYNVEDSEYITGYTTVNAVERETVAGDYCIYLQLGDAEENKDWTLPRSICHSTLLSNGHNRLDPDRTEFQQHTLDISDMVYGNGNVDDVSTEGGADNVLKEIGSKYAIPHTLALFTDWIKGAVNTIPGVSHRGIQNIRKDNACKFFNASLSYFKVPAAKAKRGGGTRVKRLLSFDPGIYGEPATEALYGTEYHYVNEDGTSSGVATNEPAAAREESALVSIVGRKKQTGFNKLFKGRDTKQFEGPIGENLLPGASVNYERVVISNINTGRSASGYAVNTYHTVRTHPTLDAQFSEINQNNDTYKKRNLPLPLGPVNIDIRRNWITQGYHFSISDMHGKPRSNATYPGAYKQSTHPFKHAAAKTTYEYTTPGKPVIVIDYDLQTQKFTKELAYPGEEEEITMFVSAVKDQTMDIAIELDLNFTMAFALTIGISPSISYTEGEMNQHSTAKVLRQVSYLVATKSEADGIISVQKTLAYSKQTGTPILTQTYDGYVGSKNLANLQESTAGHEGYYYSYNLPAFWMYPELGAKSVSPSNKNILGGSAGSITTYGSDGNILNMFAASGDSDEWNPYVDAIPSNTVIAASAVEYRKNWFSNNPTDMAGNAMPEVAAQLESTYKLAALDSLVLAALNNNYYPRTSFAYTSSVASANALGQSIYNGGTMDDFQFFNWDDPYANHNSAASSTWEYGAEAIMYSPNGMALAERDRLNIGSVVKFGYGELLPILVAGNAEYGSVFFEDFENDENATTDYAHSGYKSLDYNANETDTIIKQAVLNAHMLDRGVLVKFWVRSVLNVNPNSIHYGLTNEQPNLKVLINAQDYQCSKIAQTGEWSLYEAKITDWQGLTDGSLFDVSLSYDINYATGERVHIDDFRMQPTDAQVACTVYDTRDFRVLTQFDDQHFGVYYEYNDQGQLVRQSIETVRGMKTVQEQQSNIVRKPQ